MTLAYEWTLPVACRKLARRCQEVYNTTQPGMKYQVYDAKVWGEQPCYNGNWDSL